MDVEGILNQIRERVVSERAGSANATKLSSVPANGSAAVTKRDDALQRLRTHLAIAGRAADRLPPVFSNRQGPRARFELWLKNMSKPLTRWFTWEQVNFNRAVNEALCDVVEILKGEAQELVALTQQLSQFRTETSESQSDIERRLQQADATIARLQETAERLQETADQTKQRETELANNCARLEAEYQSLLAEHMKLADQVIDLAAQLRTEHREIRSEQDEEISRRLSQLAAELKEEQRVCFRQISLETGESAVLEDRARRALLARVEQLEEALKAGQR